MVNRSKSAIQPGRFPQSFRIFCRRRCVTTAGHFGGSPLAETCLVAHGSPAWGRPGILSQPRASLANSHLHMICCMVAVLTFPLACGEASEWSGRRFIGQFRGLRERRDTDSLCSSVSVSRLVASDRHRSWKASDITNEVCCRNCYCIGQFWLFVVPTIRGRRADGMPTREGGRCRLQTSAAPRQS